MAHVCPNCRNSEFNVVTKRNAIVQLQEQGEDTVPVVVSESEEMSFDFVTCTACGQEIVADGSNLLEVKACSTCGGYVLPEELEEGVCPGCLAPPELVGLSEKDYIKKILELQKQLNAFKGGEVVEPGEEIPDDEV